VHWLQEHQVNLQLQRGARKLQLIGNRITTLELRQGDPLSADWYLSSVPFDRLLDLLPEEIIASQAYFGNLRNLETSPITSVHCWFDRPATELPHIVLVDCVGQWVFNRGQTAANE